MKKKKPTPKNIFKQKKKGLVKDKREIVRKEIDLV